MNAGAWIVKCPKCGAEYDAPTDRVALLYAQLHQGFAHGNGTPEDRR